MLQNFGLGLQAQSLHTGIVNNLGYYSPSRVNSTVNDPPMTSLITSLRQSDLLRSYSFGINHKKHHAVAFDDGLRYNITMNEIFTDIYFRDRMAYDRIQKRSKRRSLNVRDTPGKEAQLYNIWSRDFVKVGRNGSPRTTSHRDSIYCRI